MKEVQSFIVSSWIFSEIGKNYFSTSVSWILPLLFSSFVQLVIYLSGSLSVKVQASFHPRRISNPKPQGCLRLASGDPFPQVQGGVRWNICVIIFILFQTPPHLRHQEGGKHQLSLYSRSQAHLPLLHSHRPLRLPHHLPLHPSHQVPNANITQCNLYLLFWQHFPHPTNQLRLNSKRPVPHSNRAKVESIKTPATKDTRVPC